MKERDLMWAGSLFTSFTFCNITGSCSLIPKENIRCSISCVSLIEILATINLYYIAARCELSYYVFQKKLNDMEFYGILQLQNRLNNPVKIQAADFETNSTHA